MEICELNNFYKTICFSGTDFVYLKKEMIKLKS